MTEQFEDSIRKKLQNAEAPFEPAAWDQMKSLLDHTDRRRPKVWWWVSGLLLLTAVTGWWFIRQNAKEDAIENFAQTAELPKPENIEAGKSATLPARNPDMENPGNNSGSAVNTNLSENVRAGNVPRGENSQSSYVRDEKHVSRGEKNPVHKVTGGSKNDAEQHRVFQKATGDVRKSNTRVNAFSGQVVPRGESNQEKNVASGEVNNSQTDKQDISQQKKQEAGSAIKVTGSVDNPVAKPLPGNQLLPTVTTPKENVNNSSDKNEVATLPEKQNTNLQPGVENLIADSSVKEIEKKKVNMHPRKGFDGGIYLGPDLNTTRYFKNVPLGLSAGVMVRYHVNDRWNVATGAGYSKKIYGADPKEYVTNYPVTYKSIDADCDVLDVPLNVSYVFLIKPGGRWNVTVGASSYFMLHEKYEYYYTNYPYRTREYSNENKHYFSVLNIGAGWEKHTRGKIKWGIQPYVKIPLGGVGEGKVKLYSAGVSMQVLIGKKD